MRISDWSSDVCSSDLIRFQPGENAAQSQDPADRHPSSPETSIASGGQPQADDIDAGIKWIIGLRIRRLGGDDRHPPAVTRQPVRQHRSEEHTSELQSLMRISYAVFCLKKKKQKVIIRYIIMHI